MSDEGAKVPSRLSGAEEGPLSIVEESIELVFGFIQIVEPARRSLVLRLVKEMSSSSSNEGNPNVRNDASYI